jgi:M6 family metalloprotease-like protein
MKKLFFLLITFFSLINVHAAYLRNIPMTVTQPDGTVLKCFASGDEFFNYLHDAKGFTIMRHPQTGYYVYAERRDGKLVATEFVAGQQDPSSKGLQPYALISPEEWLARRKAWEEPEKTTKNRDYNPNHGTLNNIAIFIRFSDDEELTNSYTAIDNMFNNVSEGAVSLRSYFRAASYGAIEIPTTFYPGHNGDYVMSYKDTYPRSYFEEYNASTNTNGYQDDSERTEREFSLLERAVNYINANYPIPTDLNIDYDNDGYVDNVCFIVKGGVGAWNSLLWPHKWALYGKNVYINGNRVWTFNFQLADASGYFNTSTMCHEMNHSLSAPDLYHYSYSGPTAVGIWDLMENNATPPQHCGAYMKMKYGHWVDEIPEITQAGIYTLNPISSSTPTNIAYKIATEDPNQFYVLEYRDNTSLFETALPGSGLLIYRIDTRFDGNASYDPDNGIYDEVYIFRPGGSTTANGNLNTAYFSSNAGRTEFSSSTSAYPFFTDGTIDYNFRIYNITSAGNTISFSYGTSSDCEPPTNLTASINGDDIILTWDAANHAASYNIYRSGQLVVNTNETTYTDSAIPFGIYNYYLKSLDQNGLTSSASESVTVNHIPEGNIFLGDGGSTTDELLPSYNYYNYSLTQQIYTAAELGEAGTITSLAFFNDGAEKTRTYNIYLKNTTKNTFSGTTDWETVTDYNLVYSGNVTMTSGKWNYITFDHAFEYDGNSNLVLVVDDNTGTWTGSPHMSCRVFTAPSQTLRVYSDDTNYDPMAPQSYSGTTVMNVKNQLLMVKKSNESFTITITASPSDGGTVSGGGVYGFGETCTVTALANEGFRFAGWIENENVVTTDLSYSFRVVQSRDLMAKFEEGIVIGDGGTTTNTFLPSFSYFKYSLTQQIYTAEEIGKACTINSISFFNGGAEKTRTYDFYLVTTDKTSFENSNDWVTVTEDDKVFSGAITMFAEDWNTITFDTPFIYDGTSNLILVTDDNSGNWTNMPHMACRVFDAPSQTLQVYSDDTNYNPLASENYSDTEVMDVKNQILISIESNNESEALIFEPFEDYSVGNTIATEAISVGHNWWTTWSNNPGSNEDGLVASYGGSKCGLISGTTDVVLLLDSIQEGKYDLEFDALVPEGKNGYFNILHHFDGAYSIWAMQAYLHLTNDGQNSSSSPGNGTVHAGSNNTCNLPCVYDEWMHFRIRVDIDNDIAELYFNETLMCSWQWSLDSFGDNTVASTLDAMDFYAPMSDGSSELYIDNISIKSVTSITQTIALSAGLNWVSVNVDITLDDLKDALLTALPDNIITIRSQTQNTSYNPNNHRWSGNLTWDGTKMFCIWVRSDCEITLEGKPLDVSEHPITIIKGANWIGYPLKESMSVSSVFAEFVVNGDVIRSQTVTASYQDGRWTGVFNLEPGKGYIFKSEVPGNRTFTFPTNK